MLWRNYAILRDSPQKLTFYDCSDKTLVFALCSGPLLRVILEQWGMQMLGRVKKKQDIKYWVYTHSYEYSWCLCDIDSNIRFHNRWLSGMVKYVLAFFYVKMSVNKNMIYMNVYYTEIMGILYYMYARQ